MLINLFDRSVNFKEKQNSSDDDTSFSVSYIFQRKEILHSVQNDILCHPERSEESSYAITEKIVSISEKLVTTMKNQTER
ncbi:MAG: hypothetical protein AAB116_03195 [Candidatus Poribacteria bacterium]